MMFSKDDNDGANELENLKSLVSSLRLLLDLHQKYNCRLSLSVFEKVCLLSVKSCIVLKHCPFFIFSKHRFVYYAGE